MEQANHGGISPESRPSVTTFEPFRCLFPEYPRYPALSSCPDDIGDPPLCLCLSVSAETVRLANRASSRGLPSRSEPLRNPSGLSPCSFGNLLGVGTDSVLDLSPSRFPQDASRTKDKGTPTQTSRSTGFQQLGAISQGDGTAEVRRRWADNRRPVRLEAWSWSRFKPRQRFT